jgi:hypothetical protein
MALQLKCLQKKALLELACLLDILLCTLYLRERHLLHCLILNPFLQSAVIIGITPTKSLLTYSWHLRNVN